MSRSVPRTDRWKRELLTLSAELGGWNADFGTNSGRCREGGAQAGVCRREDVAPFPRPGPTNLSVPCLSLPPLPPLLPLTTTRTGTTDSSFFNSAKDFGFWRNLYESGQWKKVGIYAVEAYGIFKIGEMIGRRSVAVPPTHSFALAES